MGSTLCPTGDVTAEYRSIRTDVGLLVGLHRLIRVHGPDAKTFLQGLVSQDIGGMSDGETARSFFLNPKGKLAAILWAGVMDEEVVLFVDEGVADRTATALSRYRIRVDAEIVLDGNPVFELWGPASYRRAAVEPGRWNRSGDSLTFAAPVGELGRVFVVGTQPDVPAVGTLAATQVRVEAGEPVMDVDVDESTIPQETGLVGEAVSFEKGCYLGQELVARIDTRGRVNRRLMGVRMLEPILPPHGAEVFMGERLVGLLTSPTESLTVRAPIGLGLIRREVSDGDALSVTWSFDGETHSVGAVAADLPFDDFTNT